MSNITATQLSASLRESFDHDVAMAKLRKQTLSTPSVRDGFKALSKVLKKALEIYPEMVNHNVYVYANSTSVDADVYIRADSLKSPEMASLIEYIEKEKVVGPAIRSEDYASSSMAQRTFVHQGNGLRLNLCVRLPTDGDACSRVKVGTKLVEQDTYEIRCA
jgi:hypothetical protein